MDTFDYFLKVGTEDVAELRLRLDCCITCILKHMHHSLIWTIAEVATH